MRQQGRITERSRIDEHQSKFHWVPSLRDAAIYIWFAPTLTPPERE
jgi:hypothetical protein